MLGVTRHPASLVQVDAPKKLVAIKCNCSICRMKHTTHFMVPASRLRYAAVLEAASEKRVKRGGAGQY